VPPALGNFFKKTAGAGRNGCGAGGAQPRQRRV